MSLLTLAENGSIPDFLIRKGIRKLCQQRLYDEAAYDVGQADQRFNALIKQLKESPVAIETQAANEQHYELPTAFFKLCLGARLKYSSAYYPNGTESLDEAEVHMLKLYNERANLQDGQHILELGCGWGSLTLWMAEHYPNSKITAVSNSATQREYINEQCLLRGFSNVTVITKDVNVLDFSENQFDRCVSVEMFEHMRNYRTLLSSISRWLKPDGKLFVHIFAHRYLMYPFETNGEDNWMGKYFFTGGLMPSADTLLHFSEHLSIEQRWLVPGRHYAQTSNHWLENQDKNSAQILAILQNTYGRANAELWAQRWRMFWMACAELFAFNNGNEWLVAHYLFQNKKPG
ncbi:MAG: class I SAM-dependent methyltransferase [Arenimonas sp.]|nr:class I SAM-dependent methyltransferase [Arenimonas sp.]